MRPLPRRAGSFRRWTAPGGPRPRSPLPTGRSLPHVLALRSVLVLPAVLVLLLAGASAQPAAAAGNAGWTVEAVAGRWQVTLRTPDRVALRDQPPVLLADGRALGVATESADGRTFVLRTGDRRVRSAGQVTLSWLTPRAAGPAAAEEPLRVAATLADDPGGQGPYAVRTTEYDRGDEAVALPSLGHRAELRAKAYLPRGAAGARPVVVLLHGRHQACYGGGRQSQPWPCTEGNLPVPSYRGYDAIGEALASHGYAVVSVSADAINAWDFQRLDAGQSARAELLLTHLDLLSRWAHGGGPLGDVQLDLTRVGLMGHSRGGEGVVRALALNIARGSPYGIRAVSLIAPTDFARATAPDVAMSVLLPYCDGDVYDLQGRHFLDDTRYAVQGDQGARSGSLIRGANHNFFNTEWTPGQSQAESFDDWYGPRRAACGADSPGRLQPREQQAVGRAYVAGFFRTFLGGEARLLPLFDGSGGRAASAGRAVVETTYEAPAGARRDVARLDGALPPGTQVTGLTAQGCAGMVQAPDPRGMPTLPPSTDPPLPPCARTLVEGQASHWSSSYLAPEAPGTAFARLHWTQRGGSVRLPVAAGDVRAYAALTMRMAPDPDGAGLPDLTVRVSDARGGHADVVVSSVSDALRRLPGGRIPLPRNELGTVRVPLADLRGVDLSAVADVQLIADRTAAGTVLVGDIAFSGAGLGAPGPVARPVVALTGSLDVPEGDAGTRTIELPVRLSQPSAVPVSLLVGVTPIDETGLPDTSGTVRTVHRRVVLAPGVVRTSVAVTIRGDRLEGYDIPVIVSLCLPDEALLGPSLVVGLVRDDDPPPS